MGGLVGIASGTGLIGAFDVMLRGGQPRSHGRPGSDLRIGVVADHPETGRGRSPDS